MSDGRWMQDAVREFHRALGQPAPDRLTLDGVRLELRAKLIVEEALETVHALGFDLVPDVDARPGVTGLRVVKVRAPDWPEVVDGLCDLLFVTFGLAVEAGFNVGPFFWEVAHSNMSKTGGPTRDDGKVLKPSTWEPPRIAFLWERVRRRAAAGLTTR